MTDTMVFEKIPKRNIDAHKGDFGRVLNIAGSDAYLGAAVLSSKAALYAGCGYLYIASKEKAIDLVMQALPEACFVLLHNEKEKEEIRNVYGMMQAVCYGCGVGNFEDTELLEYLLSEDKPLLIDADGLNRLSRKMDLLKNRKCEVVLTPHVGEFKRLSGIDTVKMDLKEKAETVREFALCHQVTVLLKGHNTLIASYKEDDIYLVDNGTPGMAKAGSGDVLSGIIASLLAQGLSPETAAYCGGWLHAEAGTLASEKCSVTAMRASDLIECLKDVFLRNGR